MRKSAWPHAVLVLAVGMASLWMAGTQTPARAALFWHQGVHTNPISVCFVGDAVTSRPQRVQQILDYIEEFEQVANIQFDYWGTCPASTPEPDSTDSFAGDIRVVLPFTSLNGTGPVPGNGCPMFNQLGPGGYNGDNDGWGSWSNAPDDLTGNRPCQYNLKLGDDPWCPGNQAWPCSPPSITPYRNHTLHEFGHALGLAHEHERLDATCYNPAKDARWTDEGFMTPYDLNSVMHYKFQTSSGHTCNVDGNYGVAGFSAWDRLGLHILYPEDNRVAEFIGSTVIRTTGTLSLQSAWKARGANMDYVAGNFLWRIDGGTVSTAPDMVWSPPRAGEYELQFSYTDFLGRNYSYTGPVRVLSPVDFDAQIVAPVAASLPLLYPNHVIPVLGASLSPSENVLLAFPANLFADTVVLDYMPLDGVESAGYEATGPIFGLDVTNLSDGQPAQVQPGQTYSMMVSYDEAVLPAGIAEDDLALYYADTTSYPDTPLDWVKEATGVVDATANTITVMPNHFSWWAILAEAKTNIYLPIVIR